MKKTARKMLGLMLALIMSMTAVLSFPCMSCAEETAGEPVVLKATWNRWIWPGEDATVNVCFDRYVKKVTLEMQDPGSLEWNRYGYTYYQGIVVGEVDDVEMKMEGWASNIPAMNEEAEVHFRMVIQYGQSEQSYWYFDITWTEERSLERIAGANRYETALLIAGEKLKASGETSYDNVVIACGTDFADALGGTYLAYINNAPILLVNKNTAVMQKIADNVSERLDPAGKVFILGGTGAVSADMETLLDASGIAPDRIVRFAGANRYDTNMKILKYCGAYDENLLICCGTNFADALSASAVGKPIMLVGKALTPDQKEYISRLTCKDVHKPYIIGGEAAVSASIRTEIGNMGFTECRRVNGENRYDTSKYVALEFFDRHTYNITLAYGQNFPDGLAGGPLSIEYGAPLLLARNGTGLYANQYVKYTRSRHAVVLGGPSLISDQLVYEILDSRGSEW